MPGAVSGRLVNASASGGTCPTRIRCACLAAPRTCRICQLSGLRVSSRPGRAGRQPTVGGRRYDWSGTGKPGSLRYRPGRSFRLRVLVIGRLVNARAAWIPGCGQADPPVSGHSRNHSSLSGYVSVTAAMGYSVLGGRPAGRRPGCRRWPDRRAAASVGYDLKGGQGGIGRIGDPAAVGRHLAQRC